MEQVETPPVGASEQVANAYAELELENARLARALAALTPQPGIEPPRGPFAARTRLAELEEQVIEARSQVQAREKDIANLFAAIEELRAEAAELASTVEATHKSFSWRITRPIRSFKTLLARKSG